MSALSVKLLKAKKTNDLEERLGANLIYDSLIRFPPHFHQFQMLQVITIVRDQLLVHSVNDIENLLLSVQI